MSVSIEDPVKLGSITTRNRIYLPAHHVSYDPESYGAYLRERARGGVGLIVASGGSPPGLSRDSIPMLRKMIEPVRAEGCPIFLQMVHIGVNSPFRTSFLESWAPLWGPSDNIPSPLIRSAPKAVEAADIQQLIDGFAQTAAVIQEAGGDGVDLHAAHGYLLSGFVSPYWNRRTDAYGGDTAGRMRLILEIGEEIRRRCGRSFVVGLKLNYDEYLANDSGMNPAEFAKALSLANASDLFDFFTVAHTDYHNNHVLIPPASSHTTAPLAAGAQAAREIVAGKVPILFAGSVRDMETAIRVVEGGQTDLVGMARALIADPHLVRKAREGRSSEIRRCVGSNQGCWRQIYKPVSCTVNPTTGREARWGLTTLGQAEAARRVLVIGGGPAGLKAAETAALRGHRVVLWERERVLGGQLRFAGALPDRDNWAWLVEDLSASVKRLGVAVNLGVTATSDAVADHGADSVIVATGATWDRSGFSTFRTDRESIPRAAEAKVMNPVDALSDLSACGQNVIIVDDNGGHTGIGIARLLAALGRKVTLVTQDLRPGRLLDDTNDFPWIYPRVVAAGIEILTSTFVERIESDHVVLSDKWTRAMSTRPAETVVLDMMRRSQEELYLDLVSRKLEVRRAGDCLAPLDVDDAVLEGFRQAAAL